MIRQLTISTFILTFCLTSWGQTSSEIKKQVTQSNTNQIDTSVILILPVVTTKHSSSEIKRQVKQANTSQIDTSVIAILPMETNLHWFYKTGKPTDLKTDDLLRIETILNKCIDKYNAKQERQFKKINDKHPEYELKEKNFIIDLTQYKRQYLAIINSKGEKEIWINCFCYSWDTDWKEEVIEVMDGGNCYFNLKINLTTGHYYELSVNGEA